ncbi:lipase family protein [Fibrisoma montanum]|nr:lipase family protein [Fibrisoma montanum]
MLTLKTFLALLLVGYMVLVTPTGCTKTESTQPVAPERVLVSSKLIGEYQANELRGRFSGALAPVQLFVRYGIKVYRIEYTTTNTDGKPVKASGALLVPNKEGAMPLISAQHGTIASDAEAPSYYKSGSEIYTFGTLFAAQGYIVAAPDYIGYGASKDLPHTYEHREGLATASLDMLRASREFLAGQKVNWDNRLFITGYSEGGYASMALQKKIEEETGNEFNLVASSLGAGAYDKTATMRYLVTSRTTTNSDYNRLYTWVLLTYDRIYGLNRPASYYFKEPYATRVAQSGRNASISVSLNDAFTDSFKKAANEGTDQAFVDAVADNDVYDWKPRTPTRLYHGTADNLVFFFNSQHAYDAMQKRGATNVKLYPIRNATHATGLVEFILGTYSFFTNPSNL